MAMAPLMIAAMAMSAAGAAVSAMGSISQGKAQAQAAGYNAQIAERNATIARQQAGADAETQRRNSMRAIGAMRANYGASGVTLEGSPMDVLESSAAEAKLDEMNIRYKGELRAIGYKDEAALDRASAKTAKQQGLMGATSAIVGGVGSAMGMGANYEAVSGTSLFGGLS